MFSLVWRTAIPLLVIGFLSACSGGSDEIKAIRALPEFDLLPPETTIDSERVDQPTLLSDAAVSKRARTKLSSGSVLEFYKSHLGDDWSLRTIGRSVGEGKLYGWANERYSISLTITEGSVFGSDMTHFTLTIFDRGD